MTPLLLFILAMAVIYVSTVITAFSALMRLSLRLMAERNDPDEPLARYLEDPLRLFIPARVLLAVLAVVAAALMARVTGLDAAIARLVKDLLLDRARKGCTVILTTHILDVAERLVDRIGIIQSGRLLAQGTLDELRLKSGRKNSTLEDVFLHLVTKPESEAA